MLDSATGCGETVDSGGLVLTNFIMQLLGLEAQLSWNATKTLSPSG